jgi:hypothetical protein
MSKKADRATEEFSYALDMVAVLSRMDLVLVPRAPDDAMIDAGAEAGNVSAAVAARIYAAMTSVDL